MDKVLFISDGQLNGKAGGALLSTMHFRMLKRYLKENLYVVFLKENENSQGSHQYKLKDNSSRLKKLICNVTGYPSTLPWTARKKIMTIVEEEEISSVFFGSSINGKFAAMLKKKYHIKIISFFIDIEAVLMKEQMKNANFMRRISLACCIRNERKTVSCSDCNIVLHERDKRLFEKTYRKEPDFKMPIVTPEKHVAADMKVHEAGTALKLLFVGAYYYPNINGILWFIDNVMRPFHRNVSLNIIGRDIERITVKDKGEMVHLIGTVEHLEKYYRDADAVIAPIFEGGGMKVKIAEALSYGKVIIGTSESLIGYQEQFPEHFINNKIFIADNTQQYIEAIDNLIAKRFFTEDSEIISHHKEIYSTEANMMRIREIIKAVAL